MSLPRRRAARKQRPTSAEAASAATRPRLRYQASGASTRSIRRPRAVRSARARYPSTSGSSGIRPPPASWRARVKTASSMGSVSFPVKVFCWLGWYEQITVRPSPAGVSTP